MGIKQFNVSSSILATSKHCRFDSKYMNFTHVEKWQVFISKAKYVPLSFYLQELPLVKLRKGQLDDDFLLVNISDQQQRSGELENIETTNEIGSDKNFLGDADIFVSKLGMPRGYIFLNTYKGKNVIGSTEFIPYKIKSKVYINAIKYILLHPFTLKAYASLESGKTPSHRRVNPYEFLKIHIPLISESDALKIGKYIAPIDKKLAELRQEVEPITNIINRVFARDFEFNLNEFESFKDKRIFAINLAELNTALIRSTCVQNSPASNYLKDFLNNRSVFLKDVLSRPIKRGKQPEYTEEGIKVIKTLNIQKGQINFNDVQYVSKGFFEVNRNKAEVSQYDLLLTSTGMGRGKFALYEGDEECLADSHVSIIRLNHQKILPQFLNYYCQSFFGVGQLKYIEMQIKGTPEIYEHQLNYFQILDIPMKQQQKIVEEIKDELNKLEGIKQQIAVERAKIDAIIEKAIQ